MSGESNMDEVETDTAPDIDGDIGGDDVVSNGDLANRRRRQQVRQACQQCRRRKIKVHASEGVMKDLRRFQSEKENDVRRYMVRPPSPFPTESHVC